MGSNLHSEYVPKLATAADRDAFRAAMLDEWQIASALGELRPASGAKVGATKALGRGHAPGQGMFSFDAAKHPRDENGHFASGPGGNFERAEARRRTRRRKHRARLKSRKYADRHESDDVRELRASHVVERVEAADSIRTDRAERHERHREERTDLRREQHVERKQHERDHGAKVARLAKVHKEQTRWLGGIKWRNNQRGGSPEYVAGRPARHEAMVKELAEKHADEIAGLAREKDEFHAGQKQARESLKKTHANERRGENEEHFRQALTYHTGQRKEEADVHRNERFWRQQDDDE